MIGAAVLIAIAIVTACGVQTQRDEVRGLGRRHWISMIGIFFLTVAFLGILALCLQDMGVSIDVNVAH
jgi:hypothetical protein